MPLEQVFVGQPWELKLNTNISNAYLDLATETKIIYKKPDCDRTEGEWDANVEDQMLVVDVPPADLDSQGVWYLQSYVKFQGETEFTPGALAVQYISDQFEKE